MFWLIHRGKRKGNILEIKSIPIGQIPIILPSQEQMNKLKTLVNEIMSIKTKDQNEDISKLDFNINKIVYELYELTPEEIAIVEGRQ